MLAPFISVQAAKGDLKALSVKASKPVVITLGKADLIRVTGDIADVLVADPSVIDVQAVQSNSLYVVGKSVGDTNIIALDGLGNVMSRIDVHVTYDLLAIQDTIDTLFPKENVKVSGVADQILLTGEVSDPETASKIVNLAGRYVSNVQGSAGSIDGAISNMLEVRGEQQVMLQVKILEASRTVLKELGINTTINNAGAPNAVGRNSSFALTPAGGAGLTQQAVGVAQLLTNTGLSGIGGLNFQLSALEQRNLVNILAEPNLTAISGQEAGFLAGGEFPVPSGRDQVGNIVVEFREFGVSLNFRPTVLSSDRISLKMNTEVSSLNRTNAVTLAGLQVPGLDIRRADTTVEIPSGGSLMIAGILRADAIDGMSGLPGIADTPIIGDLIKSDNFRRNETELIVIVTPYLVEPYAETDRADPVPVERNNPLARSFAANIRRNYTAKIEDMFDADQQYGYLLD